MNMRNLLIITFLAVANCLLAQINYSANDQINPYTGNYLPGVNPGYYGGNWNNFDLTDLSAGNAALNMDGAGVKAIRGTLPEHYGIIWDYNNWIPVYEYYEALGIKDNTLVVGVAHPDHRDPVDYCASDPTETTMFANLYEPIWDGGANGTAINENNYMAKYVYDLIMTVGDHVKFWEVWNEPGFDLSGYKSSLQPGQPGNWWDNDPDPCDIILRAPIQNYIRTLRITYEVVKTYSPDDYIVLSGIGTDAFLDALMRNTDNPNGGQVTPEYPLKSGAYFDVVGFHAYPSIDGSTQHWDNNIGGMVFTRHSDGAVDGFNMRVDNRKNLLASYGYNGSTYPNKLMIVTEMDVPRLPFGNAFGSDDLQKNYIMKSIAHANKIGILQTHVWQLAERTTEANAVGSFDVMGFYKNINDLEPGQAEILPQGVAHASASNILAETTYSPAKTNSLNLPANIGGGAYKKNDGSYIYMLWAKTQTDMSENAFAMYSFPAAYGAQMDVRYWDFSATNIKNTVSSQNIALSGTPLFFNAPQNSGTLTLNCPAGNLVETPAPGVDGGAIVNWATPTATTTCPGGNVTLTSTGGNSGEFFPFGTTVVSYKATDNCGNTKHCAMRVAVASTGGINSTCQIALWNFNFSGQRDGHKYFISKFAKTYQEAKDIAASYGAKLLSIETQAENDFLKNQFADLGYIGLSDAQSEGNLTWESGAPVTFTSLDDCSWCLPNTATNDFAEFHPWNGKWSFSDGTEPKLFMMEFDCGNPTPTSLTVNSFPANIQMTVDNGTNVSWSIPTASTTCAGGAVNITQIAGPAIGTYFVATGNPVVITYSFSDNCGNSATQSFTVTINPQQTGGCPPSISGFTTLGEYNGHKYFLSNGLRSWSDNKSFAEANAGYLVVINDPAENAFVKNHISEMVHIGINDVQVEGTLAWVNGDNVGYTNLSSCSWCGLNDGAHDFGLMAHWDGKWSFDQQWASRRMVMEVNCGDSGGGDLSVSCPADVVSSASGGMNVSWNVPVASTTCAGGNVSISQSAGPSNGSYFAATNQPVTISYTISDNCGNTQVCSFSVTVNTQSGGGCPNTIIGYTTLGEFNGHKYYLSNSSHNWSENNNLAQANNGYLAVINDAAENAFLKNVVSELVHVGFTDETNEGLVQWVNGDAMSYTNYSNCDWCGLNTNANDYGVFLFWDGKWSFDHQWAARKSVVEMDCGGSSSNQPDLTVSNITNLSASGNAGSTVDFQFDLNNVGMAPALGNYSIKTYLSTNASFSGDDVLMGNVPTGGTPVGTISSVPNTVAIPSVSNGDYFILLIADFDNNIAESNENNNMIAVPFTVGSGGGSNCPTTLVGYSYLGKYGNHAYFLSENMANWNDAKMLTTSVGGYLASIGSQGENEFLRMHINDYTFIGLNDAAQEGQFAWQNGNPLTFNLLDGSNSGANDFAVMNFWNGHWSLVNQYVAKNFVIEMDCNGAQPMPAAANQSWANRVSLYPNPANDVVFVNFVVTQQQEVKLAVFDMLGKEVLRQNHQLEIGTETIELNIADLNSGMYLVRLSDGTVLRFVKNQ